MMIATVPFVAVGFLFSLTAEEADLGRRLGGKEGPKSDIEAGETAKGDSTSKAADTGMGDCKASGETVRTSHHATE